MQEQGSNRHSAISQTKNNPKTKGKTLPLINADKHGFAQIWWDCVRVCFRLKFAIEIPGNQHEKCNAEGVKSEGNSSRDANRMGEGVNGERFDDERRRP